MFIEYIVNSHLEGEIVKLIKKIYYRCIIKWLEFEYNDIMMEMKIERGSLSFDREDLQTRIKVNRNRLSVVKQKLSNL